MPKRSTLGALIEKIAARAEAGEHISIATIQEIAGRRIAGPLLLFPALVLVSPLSLVPTLPTIVALIIILVAGQLILGARKVWLPRRLAQAALSPERALKVVEFIRPAVDMLGKVSKPRLKFLVDGIGLRIACGICVLVALFIPPMEFVPGASTTAGVIIATFGLALTMRDGVLLLIALTLVLGAGNFFFSRLIRIVSGFL